MGRLFSTVRFVKEIIFVEEAVAIGTMERIGRIHQAVERERGEQIPDWAHRDVLYMLLDYSERAYQLLHRPLTVEERDELYNVFWRVGQGLRIPELPDTYPEWRLDRATAFSKTWHSATTPPNSTPRTDANWERGAGTFCGRYRPNSSPRVWVGC